MGTIYLVSTPIGNIKDITLRAIETLNMVSVILCEDTRKTANLLQKLNVKTSKLISFYEETEQRKIPEIISWLLAGEDIALVSNAGTPLISDPGFKLVRECIAQNIKVQVIPGPSAITTALVVSGLPTDKFIFLGFLPKKEGKLKTYLTNLPIKTTIIFYDSPFRIIKSLQAILNIYGDIDIVVCRELTKIFEEIRREKISSAISHFTQNKPRGEFTCLFHLE